MRISPAEWKRKLVHLGVGLLALALRFLSWPAAAAAALAALLFNLLVMPRIGRGIYRDAARARDPGIVAYPATVLLLVLLFRHHLEIAAAVWAMMAAGDPLASVAGKLLGGPRLPWNREKTWAGVLAYALFGGAALAAVFSWTIGAPFLSGVGLGVPTLVGVSLAAAFLESLRTGLDDNWIPPIPAGLLLYASLFVLPWYAAPVPGRLATALVVNAAIAAAAGGLRVVSPSGAVAGGAAGTLLLCFGGWGAYGVLWFFFLAGTLATRLGWAEKTRRGTAQTREGRRGIEHVAANCSTGIVIAAVSYAIPARVLPGAGALLGTALAASFAAALADTLGTEFGSLYGRTAFSMTRMSAAPPGTPGAVSWPGTAGGLFGALVVGLLAAALGVCPWTAVPAVACAGLLGSLSESLLLDWGSRTGRKIDHEFSNAFNTVVAAGAAIEILASLDRGRLYLPIEAARQAVAR